MYFALWLEFCLRYNEIMTACHILTWFPRTLWWEWWRQVLSQTEGRSRQVRPRPASILGGRGTSHTAALGKNLQHSNSNLSKLPVYFVYKLEEWRTFWENFTKLLNQGWVQIVFVFIWTHFHFSHKTCVFVFDLENENSIYLTIYLNRKLYEIIYI